MVCLFFVLCCFVFHPLQIAYVLIRLFIENMLLLVAVVLVGLEVVAVVITVDATTTGGALPALFLPIATLLLLLLLVVLTLTFDAFGLLEPAACACECLFMIIR